MKKRWKILLVAFTFVFIGVVGSHPAHAQNNCLDFDGTSDYVTVPDSDVFDFTSFTVEAWIRSKDLTGNHNIIGKANEEWLPASTGFDLETSGTQLYGSVWDLSGNQKYIMAGTLTANMWQHVAMTWTTGGSLILYINGNNIGSQPSTFSGTIANAGPMKIGAFPWVLQYYWNGQIDEVRIWNDVRTESEIRANMYKELAGTETGLVAYYKLNETDIDDPGYAADSSANTNNGTYENSMTDDDCVTSGAFAGPRDCLDFDGTDDYVNCADAASGITGTITVEAWVKTPSDWDGTPPYPQIVSRGSSNTNGFNLYIYSAGDESRKFSFILMRDGGSWGSDWVLSDVPIETDKWYHLAGIRDGTNTLKLYVNGVMSQENGGSGDIVYGSSPTTHIGIKSASSDYFKGRVDEVRVWNTARTAAQIRDTMCKTLIGDETGLVAYYRFDQENAADQTILYDLTSNINNGTLANMDSTTDWVASTAFNAWIGSEGTSWATNGNWSRGSVPGSSDNVGVYSYSGGTNASLSGSPAINHFILGDSSSMTLSSGATVNGNLFLESNLNLNGQTITLGSSALLVEDVGLINDTSGTITTTRSLSNITSENIAGLGAEITTSANMGTTTITRGVAAQSGYLGHTGIKRYYNINPTTNTGLNATLVFHYDDSELNGITEANLVLYKSNDNGSTWTQVGATLNTSANTLTISSLDGFSWWTAGDSDSPLLVDLVSFTADALEVSVLLTWKTASEINNAGFHLWRSDAKKGEYLRITDILIPAQGGPAWGAEYEYEDFDVEPGLTYFYELEDIDYDGVSTFHGPVSATMSEAAISLESPEDGVSVSPSYPPPTFEWEGADLDRFKLQFSTDLAFKKKVIVLPSEWIEEGLSYTPSQKEWRKVSHLGRKDQIVYWRVYGEDEAGKSFVSETFGLTIEN